MLDKMKMPFNALVDGFLFALYIWMAFLVINNLPGLFGLSFTLTLPGALALAVNPFVMGPILALIKMIHDYVKGL